MGMYFSAARSIHEGSHGFSRFMDGSIFMRIYGFVNKLNMNFAYMAWTCLKNDSKFKAEESQGKIIIDSV